MIKTWNPKTLALPFGTYSHCCVVHKDCELPSIAGVQSDRLIAEGIKAQCEWVIGNLLAVPSANGMAPENLIKFGIFLTDRIFIPVYREVSDRIGQ
jgi:enamine deaminase RidA (YjgF/YER057c/UK114 family)